MPMQLRGLRTFCLAARHLSFKNAADELCLSASAVSHQISDLEEELGARLFERHTRAVSLTPKGDQLYEELRPHLDAIDDAAVRTKRNAGRVPLLVQLPEFFTSELILPIINVSTILLHKARPHAWTRWARHAGIGNMKPKQIIFVDSMFALARAAQQGAGIALVPMPVSKAWFDSGELVPLHDTALVTGDYYWMTRNDESRNTEATDVFWRWIGENLQQHALAMDEMTSSVA